MIKCRKCMQSLNESQFFPSWLKRGAKTCMLCAICRGSRMLKRLALVIIVTVSISTDVFGSNEYYQHGSFPSPSSPATSASMRAEFDLIAAGFDKLPTLTGFGGRLIAVNPGGTALVPMSGGLSLSGNLTLTGAFNTTFAQSATTTLNLPGASGTLSTLAGIETFTNKSLTAPNIGAPNFSGTATGSLAGLTLTTPSLTTATIASPTFSGSASGSLANLSLVTPIVANPNFSGTAGGSLTGLALTTPVLTNATVAADPTTPLGVASKQYVDAVWVTGDVKVTLQATAPAGWIVLNDGTIGSAASGATTRAHADTSNLYALIWGNCPDQWCPVTGGRGANAAADFAANKSVQIPRAVGRVIAGWHPTTGPITRESGTSGDVDTTANTLAVGSNTQTWITGMPVTFTLSSGSITGLTSGNTYYVIRSSATTVKLASSLADAQNIVPIDLTAKSSPVWTIQYNSRVRALGEYVGEEFHAMSETELLSHTHSGSISTSNINAGTSSGTSVQNPGSIGSTGGNAAMNIMQPTLFLNLMMKL